MPKTFILNGTDYTAYFLSRGYSVRYIPIDGGQGGYMQSGSYTEDEIALKAEISLPCRLLTEEQAGALLADVYSGPYVTLTYYDPRTNADRTITGRRSVSGGEFWGAAADASNRWDKLVLTVTER